MQFLQFLHNKMSKISKMTHLMASNICISSSDATTLIHDDIPRGLALHAGRKALALLAERNELLAETLGSLWIDYGSLNPTGFGNDMQ